jgi:hypothetical protein
LCSSFSGSIRALVASSSSSSNICCATLFTTAADDDDDDEDDADDARDDCVDRDLDKGGLGLLDNVVAVAARRKPPRPRSSPPRPPPRPDGRVYAGALSFFCSMTPSSSAATAISPRDVVLLVEALLSFFLSFSFSFISFFERDFLFCFFFFSFSSFITRGVAVPLRLLGGSHSPSLPSSSSSSLDSCSPSSSSSSDFFRFSSFSSSSRSSILTSLSII